MTKMHKDERFYRYCTRCGHKILGGVQMFSIEDGDGIPMVLCEKCTNERTDEKLAAGILKISVDGTIFDPLLFPDKEEDLLDTTRRTYDRDSGPPVKECLTCGKPIPIARVISKCNDCIDEPEPYSPTGLKKLFEEAAKKWGWEKGR